MNTLVPMASPLSGDSWSTSSLERHNNNNDDRSYFIQNKNKGDVIWQESTLPKSRYDSSRFFHSLIFSYSQTLQNWKYRTYILKQLWDCVTVCPTTVTYRCIRNLIFNLLQTANLFVVKKCDVKIFFIGIQQLCCIHAKVRRFSCAQHLNLGLQKNWQMNRVDLRDDVYGCLHPK